MDPEVTNQAPAEEPDAVKVGNISFEEPVVLRPQDDVKRAMELSARSGHVPGKRVTYENADYVVHRSGAWVRLTERAVSRNTHNKSCRRRLAKGK